MKYIVNVSQMKAVDQYSIEEIGIPAMVLMEQAAMSVAAVIRNSVDRNSRILAVCGMGNNGGDGIAAARILREYGYQVTVMMVGDKNKITEQTSQQLVIAQKLGVDIINNGRIAEYNVIIDALFGIGLSKSISGEFERIIREINEGSNQVFAVDIPSGINGDDGHVMNVAVKADTTITFGLNKIGLVLYPGCLYAGEIIVADIGFPGKAVAYAGPNTVTFEEVDLRKLPVRRSYSNKGTYGKVLVIAGSKNMSGACCLSARACYRSGAGLVRVMTDEVNRTIVQTTLPEAILTTYDSGCIDQYREPILEAIKWATVIIIGPGISVTEASEYLLNMVLQHGNVPTIIDADAITLMANRQQSGEIQVPDHVIITPHVKEMSVFAGKTVDQITDNLITAACDVIHGGQSVVVLKDARTVVTDGKQVYINLSGNHGMATGGSGDVLTGIIAALLAQGLSQFMAATLGVYVHGLAGDYAANQGSAYSLMAGDIIEALPRVLDYKGDMT